MKLTVNDRHSFTAELQFGGYAHVRRGCEFSSTSWSYGDPSRGMRGSYVLLRYHSLAVRLVVGHDLTRPRDRRAALRSRVRP